MSEAIPPWRKARVFKAGRFWIWEHRCRDGGHALLGYHHFSHARALRGALRHLRGCK